MSFSRLVVPAPLMWHGFVVTVGRVRSTIAAFMMPRSRLYDFDRVRAIFFFAIARCHATTSSRSISSSRMSPSAGRMWFRNSIW